MAKLLTLSSKTLNSLIFMLLLATTFATSARILEDVSPDSPDLIPPPETDIPEAAPPSTDVIAPVPDPTTPSEPVPTTTPPLTTTTAPPATTAPVTTTTTGATTAPVTTTTAGATTATTNPAATATAGATTTTPVVTATATSGGAATVSGAISGDDHPTLSFFMHDILGGTRPSGRAVTGIAANSDAANALPFSKPSNPIFPINGGVPLNTVNTAINNNNYPFLVGLNNGSPNTVIGNNNGVTGINNNNNNNNNQAFVTAGQLPAALTLQQLMFGSITVVDNELTEGHELGTNVIGKAQGFYLTSSSDGSSHTVALTAVFHGDEHGDHEIVDTVSFFGVHRTATPISHIAIVGGTGKYENAKGYATIETLPHVDQHLTDGLETITHFTLYLTP